VVGEAPRLPRVLHRLWAAILVIAAAALIVSGVNIDRGRILAGVAGLLVSVMCAVSVFLLRMNWHQLQVNKALAEENAGLRRALDADAPGGAS
jgi:hypothetical protein